MSNNQKQQSKHLSRDEFEKYLLDLCADQLIDLMPVNIVCKTNYDDITRPNLHTKGYEKKHVQLKLDWVMSSYFEVWYYGDSDFVSVKEIFYRSIDPKYGAAKMLLRLYDNGHLPQYSTPKQVG